MTHVSLTESGPFRVGLEEKSTVATAAPEMPQMVLDSTCRVSKPTLTNEKNIQYLGANKHRCAKSPF